jgi:hypothetical protein
MKPLKSQSTGIKTKEEDGNEVKKGTFEETFFDLIVGVLSALLIFILVG